MIDHNTDTLSEQMQQKHELLSQLRDLGQHQIELIVQGDLSRLLKLLAAKQRLMNALQTVERTLEPFRHQDPNLRAWRTAEDRRCCAETATNCEALLAAIVEQERHSESEMTIRRDVAAARLQGLHHAAQIHHAYSEDTAPYSSAQGYNSLDLSTQG